MHLRKILIALSMFALCTHPLCGEEAEEGAKKALEFPSPDGHFAFRSTGESEDDERTFDLVGKASGKKLVRVAKSEADLGPSSRFNMEVLWRPDSKAFALTAMVWKRGSYVAIFVRDGATFREVKLPELEAEIPDKIKAGKSYPHIVSLNSQEAKRWQKDGSLVVVIDNAQDGEGSMITATRTVVLGFDKPGKARVLKSTTKYGHGEE